MSLMTQAIRNGRSIQSPGIGATSSSLSLTAVNSLLNPVVFSVSSSTLRITEGSKSPVALTNSHIQVSALTFHNISSTSSTEKIIRISYTIDFINLSGRSEYTYTKTFNGSATLR